MQDQLTSGQSSLQQQSNSLQQNNSNIQQGGSPAVSSDVFTVLSQNAQTNGLQVQSAQTDPSAQPQVYTPEQSPVVWIVPAAFIVAICVALILWARMRRLVAVEPVASPEAVSPAANQMPTPAPRKGKKTTRRKRQAKR